MIVSGARHSGLEQSGLQIGFEMRQTRRSEKKSQRKCKQRKIDNPNVAMVKVETAQPRRTTQTRSRRGTLQQATKRGRLQKEGG